MDRISSEEFANALKNIMSKMPPISEDIELIKLNPSISKLQKFLIIRSIRKKIKQKERSKTR